MDGEIDHIMYKILGFLLNNKLELAQFVHIRQNMSKLSFILI